MSATDDTLTLRQLNRATLARQLLLDRADIPVSAAVERLCGIQAQEARPPFVGLWSRVAGFRTDDLHSLLHKRTAVRATFLRGTLHVLSAKDYATFRPVMQPVLSETSKVLGSRAKGLEIDKVLPVATALLQEQPRDFNELRALLQAEFPDVNDRALGFTVRMWLPLVMVPTDDRWAFPSVAAFTLAEDWLSAPLSEDDTPDELVRRYLAAFGPATAADVQTWSGLRGIKQVLARLRPELITVRDEKGRELFDLPDAPRPDGDVPAPPRFLPEFDNLVLSHAERTRVIADEHRGHVVTKNLRVRASVFYDGFACGIWDIERKKNSVTLRVTPFRRLPAAAVGALTDEAAEVLSFIEPDAPGAGVKFEEPLG
ncbi:MAG TPA: winged helix DNA-binding domain-containing protein [Pseudonocardiaceae bacterium]|nr:winged helix DNA-binding domain-containing protein [Pseudonocardiaceae bacterium]